jgi:hypothetical protein
LPRRLSRIWRSQRGPFVAALVVSGALRSSVTFADDNPHGHSGAAKLPTSEKDATDAPAPTAASPSETVVKAKAEMSVYSDTDAVSVFTPAVEGSIANPIAGWTASGSYLADIVSAASVDIVSTASNHWVETRHAATLSGGYKPGTVGFTAAGSVSREPDYLSLTGGGILTFELADKTANPSIGYSYSHDTAGRKTTPFSVFSLPLARHSVNASLELILDPLTLVSFSLDGIFERGDQSKPYRFIPLFAPGDVGSIPSGASVDLVKSKLSTTTNEHTPDTRNRFALSGRVAQRLSGSTLVLTERIYLDDWGLKASTTDLRTHIRGHFQSGVSFWHRAYALPTAGGPNDYPKLRTGDRELSPLSAGTFGGGLRWNVGPASHMTAWSVVAQADLLTTVFSDTLYIQNRQGYLGVLQLEAEL